MLTKHKIINRISAKRRHAFIVAAVVLVDMIVVSVAFLCAHSANVALPFFHINPYYMEATVAQHLPMLPVLLVACALAFWVLKLYDFRHRWEPGEIAFSVFVAVSLSMALVLVFSYMTKQFGFSRLMLIYVWIFTCALVFLSRVGLYTVLVWRRLKKIGVRRVLIAGLTEAAFMLERQYSERPELGCDVIGFLEHEDEVAYNGFGKRVKEKFDQGRVLGTVDDTYDIARRHGVSVVVLTGSLSTKAEILPIIDRCYAEGIEVKAIPDIFEVAPRYMEFERVGNVPVVAFHDHPPIGWQVVLKRLIDITGSLLGLILLAPLFAVVAVMIKRESHGSVFIAQERSGQNGKPFRMYKFRSMVASAADGPPVKVKANDPRVTRVGAFIRRTSIDELPQLFNVLKGDMSLVGPRPETFLYVDEYSEWNRRRLYLRPGITGLAQAEGVRGNTSIDDKTKFDLEYMEKQSVWLDIKILVKTVVSLFKHKEAY
jgi:exopolysaccharide biosynthesis polyprenyl glycosylphosphotransferase